MGDTGETKSEIEVCTLTLPQDKSKDLSTLQNILNRKRNVAQKTYNSQFTSHLCDEIVSICNDKILVQR